jgi:hypothetical protein
MLGFFDGDVSKHGHQGASTVSKRAPCEKVKPKDPRQREHAEKTTIKQQEQTDPNAIDIISQTTINIIDIVPDNYQHDRRFGMRKLLTNTLRCCAARRKKQENRRIPGEDPAVSKRASSGVDRVGESPRRTMPSRGSTNNRCKQQYQISPTARNPSSRDR